jgi:hypothetical protein
MVVSRLLAEAPLENSGSSVARCWKHHKAFGTPRPSQRRGRCTGRLGPDAERRHPLGEAGLRFARVPERSGEESVEQRLRRLAELGRLLAAAASYRVV